MRNKTIELYNYEDEFAKTELTINSLFDNDNIFSLKQIDIEYIKIFLKHGLFIIKGYITPENKNTLNLNEWARTIGTKKEWLKRIDLKVVKSGYVLREYIFNGFVADYMEFYNKGKYRFFIVIRQYKLKTLDFDYDETGASKVDSYVRNINIKNVSNELIIYPVEWSKIFTSTSNLMGVLGLTQTVVKSDPVSVSFILIAHTTGMITEFMADVYFVAKGKPDKMGSFNMTRDLFYKPLGDIIKNAIEQAFPKVQFNDTFGEDIYNIGNLTFSAVDLGSKAINGFKALTSTKGEGIVFTIKIKNVKVSRFGRQLQPKKYVGLTPVKATALFVKDMGLDIYATKEGFKSEFEKRNYPTIKNITIPKNSDKR